MKSLLAILLFVLGSITLQAQTAGTITGQLVDTSGKPIVAVAYIVELKKGAPARPPDGQVVIRSVPPGSYTVLISAIGYRNERRGVILIDSTNVDFGIVELVEGMRTICRYPEAGWSLTPGRAGTIRIIRREQLWGSR